MFAPARYHSDIIDTILDTATDTRKVVLFSDQDGVGFTGGFTPPAHVDSTASEQSVSEMIFREVYVTVTICRLTSQTMWMLNMWMIASYRFWDRDTGSSKDGLATIEWSF